MTLYYMESVADQTDHSAGAFVDQTDHSADVVPLFVKTLGTVMMT